MVSEWEAVHIWTRTEITLMAGPVITQRPEVTGCLARREQSGLLAKYLPPSRSRFYLFRWFYLSRFPSSSSNSNSPFPSDLGRASKRTRLHIRRGGCQSKPCVVQDVVNLTTTTASDIEEKSVGVVLRAMASEKCKNIFILFSMDLTRHACQINQHE